MNRGFSRWGRGECLVLKPKPRFNTRIDPWWQSGTHNIRISRAGKWNALSFTSTLGHTYLRAYPLTLCVMMGRGNNIRSYTSKGGDVGIKGSKRRRVRNVLQSVGRTATFTIRPLYCSNPSRLDMLKTQCFASRMMGYW